MKYASRMNVVRGSVIRDVATEIAARNNPNMIKLSGGLPDGALFPKQGLKDAADKIFANDALCNEALQYGLTRGDTELLEILAKRLNEVEKMDVDMNNITVTTGCQQGISLVATAMIDNGDAILIEKPSYLDGLNAVLPYEPNIVGVDTDEQGICIEALAKAIEENPKTKIIYVIPNFQNPTGRGWTLERRKEFLEFINQPKYDGIYVLEDNPYGEIRFSGEFVPTLKALDKGSKVIYISSFSKILCPGLRVAYMVSNDKEFIDRIEEIKEGADLQSNQFAQVQVRELLKSFDLNKHIDTIKESYRVKCEAMIEIMKQEFPEGFEYTIPEGGMFLWVTCPSHVDTTKLLSKALDNEVSFIPGSSFFADGSGTNTMRLNFTANSKEKIIEGIKRLAKVFREIQ